VKVVAASRRRCGAVRMSGPKHSKVLDYLGNNCVRYRCPSGHEFTAEVLPNPRVRPSDQLCRKLAAYWQETGGVIVDCPHCQETQRAAA
jgi:hypothetical protein